MRKNYSKPRMEELEVNLEEFMQIASGEVYGHESDYGTGPFSPTLPPDDAKRFTLFT